ncbi:hypothetical protein EVAR_18917_1 [Eumeta japonica]|uniref:Uncharacterized protein n=1 Tax=Eumeta variegata TaxID=151549 RepID=A0A4C1V3Y9_EUMVA|nr:hypothetical protein EVAR_18917_1 [Eumeta japonica]
MEMRFLRSRVEWSLKYKCRNSDIREQCDLKDVVTRVEKGDRKVGKDHPRKFYAFQIGGILKKCANCKHPQLTCLHEKYWMSVKQIVLGIASSPNGRFYRLMRQFLFTLATETPSQKVFVPHLDLRMPDGTDATVGQFARRVTLESYAL